MVSNRNRIEIRQNNKIKYKLIARFDLCWIKTIVVVISPNNPTKL